MPDPANAVFGGSGGIFNESTTISDSQFTGQGVPGVCRVGPWVTLGRNQERGGEM